MITALVTGANKGMGLEFCRQLLARIDELTPETSGRFLHRNGQVLPW
jgi:hypothetical protein